MLRPPTHYQIQKYAALMTCSRIALIAGQKLGRYEEERNYANALAHHARDAAQAGRTFPVTDSDLELMRKHGYAV